jgi:hypothetical protein
MRTSLRLFIDPDIDIAFARVFVVACARLAGNATM